VSLATCPICGVRYLQGDVNHHHALLLALRDDLPLPWWLAEKRAALREHYAEEIAALRPVNPIP
jgi:hypothetical protein